MHENQGFSFELSDQAERNYGFSATCWRADHTVPGGYSPIDSQLLVAAKLSIELEGDRLSVYAKIFYAFERSIGFLQALPEFSPIASGNLKA